MHSSKKSQPSGGGWDATAPIIGRMDPEFWLLGPEGDRLDALAAMHAVAASLALALRGRASGPRRKAIERQERALTALAAALARLFRRQDEPGLDLDVEAAGIGALMARAAAREGAGLRHDRLVKMPSGWPFKRLAINPAQLALAAVMRLRGALQDLVIRDAAGRRQVQLGAVRGLEKELTALAHALDRHETTTPAALRSAVDRFAGAATLIGPADIDELLGPGAERPAAAGTTILTGAPHGFAA